MLTFADVCSNTSCLLLPQARLVGPAPDCSVESANSRQCWPSAEPGSAAQVSVFVLLYLLYESVESANSRRTRHRLEGVSMCTSVRPKPVQKYKCGHLRRCQYLCFCTNKGSTKVQKLTAAQLRRAGRRTRLMQTCLLVVNLVVKLAEHKY